MNKKECYASTFPPEQVNGQPTDKRVPRISIITPSYQQGEFIESTIKSLQSQQSQDFEHIVIDRNSTDETGNILASYEGRHPIRWLSESDDGQADAIMKGFALCRGSILTWLNSDDIYVSSKVLNRVIELFDEYPDVQVLTAGGVELSATGKWQRLIPVRQDYYTYERLCWADHVLQPATFFRREVISRIKLDTTLHYAFDWDFFIRLSKDYNLLAVDEIWAGYRMTGFNKTSNGGCRRSAELKIVIKRHTGVVTIQYLSISIYHALLCMSAVLPKRAQKLIQKAVRKTSGIIQVLSFHRLTGV